MKANSSRLSVAMLLAIAVACPAQSAPGKESRFELLGRYRALGGLVASTVAPGPTPGSERIYGSYLYADNTLDVIAVNPDTGAAEVFHNPAPGEYGARNIAVGPDGDVYLGSLPRAHFLRVDRKTHRMIDLGRPSPAEEYIWDIAFATDHRLYGVTYPGCRLVRYDPATHKMDDLGRMDPTEKYGRWIVAGNDGYLYIGIGTAKANIAVFNTRTGELREVLPPAAQSVGIAKPYAGVDGKVYATLNDRLFRLDGFAVHEVPAKDKVPEVNHNILRDGRVLDLSEGNRTLIVTEPGTHIAKRVPISYEGEDLQVFRVGFGPDGELYGSSILPIHFVHFDAGRHLFDALGDLGGGEVYSFLASHDRLLMGTYSGLAPLMAYRPGAAFKPASDGNPLLVDYTGSDHAWRPQAMIAGPDGLVYVGATAGYGKLQAPLLSWDGTSGSVTLHDDIVADQSVVSLASWRNFIVGGTTTQGGGGSHPTQTDARIFLWSIADGRKVFDTIPVPGAQTITGLVTAPSGLIYGIAISHASHTLFAFDPVKKIVVSTQPLPWRNVPYNAIGVSSAGTILGLAEEGIFTIDDSTHTARLLAPSPVKITGGFALRDGFVYFIANSELYRYREASTHAR